MYVIKDKFDLLANIENVTNISESQIKSMEIEYGLKKFYNSIRTNVENKKGISYNILLGMIKSKFIYHGIKPVLWNEYKMAVIFDQKTDMILINISYFNIDDIYSGKPDPNVLIACMVYGHVLRQTVNKSVNIHDTFAEPIVAFLNTVVLSIFGKSYGLIGAYSYRIPILKYLTACYVLASFFGISGSSLYEKAKKYSGIAFRDEIENLKNYDFSNILDYIRCISDSRVMRGFTVHEFTHKIYRFLGIHFLAAIEDFSRFMALMTISSLPGNSFVPFSLKKYNQKAYLGIVKTCHKLYG